MNCLSTKDIWLLTQDAWLKMKRQCFFSAPRGVYQGMCDRWFESFDNFLEDMGPRPSIKYAIRIIDLNKEFGPGNCEWFKKKHAKKYDGKIKWYIEGGCYATAETAARALDIPVKTILNRVAAGKPEYSKEGSTNRAGKYQWVADHQTFNTAQEAANSLKLSLGTVLKRIAAGRPGYYKRELTGETIYVAPVSSLQKYYWYIINIRFDTAQSAADYYGMHINTIFRRVNKGEPGYAKVPKFLD